LHGCKGLVCKNLFLKDKKKKFWLVTAQHDQRIDLSWLSKQCNANGMRFASEETLLDKLNVSQGSVTPLALLFDESIEVNFILDKSLSLDDEIKIFSHPMVNTASLGMSYFNFKKFIEHTQHKITVVDFACDT